MVDCTYELLSHLSAVENQFSDLRQKISEVVKFVAVFEKASNEYGVILANITRDKGTALTMDDLEESMKLQWCITKGGKESSNVQNKEYVLSIFNGKCYKCEEIGHKTNKCPNTK